MIHSFVRPFETISSPTATKHLGWKIFPFNFLLKLLFSSLHVSSQLTTTIWHSPSCLGIWQRQRPWRVTYKADSIRIMAATTAITFKRRHTTARLTTFRWGRKTLNSFFNGADWCRILMISHKNVSFPFTSLVSFVHSKTTFALIFLKLCFCSLITAHCNATWATIVMSRHRQRQAHPAHRKHSRIHRLMGKKISVHSLST